MIGRHIQITIRTHILRTPAPQRTCRETVGLCILFCILFFTFCQGTSLCFNYHQKWHFIRFLFRGAPVRYHIATMWHLIIFCPIQWHQLENFHPLGTFSHIYGNFLQHGITFFPLEEHFIFRRAPNCALHHVLSLVVPA